MNRATTIGNKAAANCQSRGADRSAAFDRLPTRSRCGFPLLCSRNGILSENRAQSHKLKYTSPAHEKEECPEGKAAKLSSSNRVSVCWQIPEVTREDASLSRECPNTPTIKPVMRQTSASHRASKLGRGFPTISFRPDVTKSVPAREAQRPISPVWISHSVCSHILLWGIVGGNSKKAQYSAR